MVCPKCSEEVDMINDSFVNDKGYVFEIGLECPECEWLFIGDYPLDNLMPVEPVKDK